MLDTRDKLLIVPIGGVDRVGANCTLIGSGGSWLMVDLGVSFYNKYGVDLLVPDMSFPIKIKKHLKGVIVTHSHEDHIGAIPYLWPQLMCPIYLTEFPAAVLRQKLENFPWKDGIDIRIVKHGERVEIGDFVAEFLPLTHSTLDSSGVYLKSSNGSVFHTGDWKIDENPMAGKIIDEARLDEIGNEGVDCLLCDSTNIMNADDSGSESSVMETFNSLLKKFKDRRVTVTCFASNIARIMSVLDAAKCIGKKVSIIGRSMHKMIKAVGETSYFSDKFKSSLSCVVPQEAAAKMNPSDLVLLCTGSQGELRSALYKIARGEDNFFRFDDKDVVLFSSKVIPGNEVEIRNLQNMLVENGVEILTSDIEKNLHVSGHPGKKSVLQMYKWIKPKSLIPVHGDQWMLLSHKKFAKDSGLEEVRIPKIGEVISCKRSGGKASLEVINTVDATYFAVDGVSIVPFSSPSLRDRSLVAENGLVSLSVVSRESKSKTKVDIGVAIIGIPLSVEMYAKMEGLVKDTVNEALSSGPSVSDFTAPKIKKLVAKLFDINCRRRPVVVFHMLHV